MDTLCSAENSSHTDWLSVCGRQPTTGLASRVPAYRKKTEYAADSPCLTEHVFTHARGTDYRDTLCIPAGMLLSDAVDMILYFIW